MKKRWSEVALYVWEREWEPIVIVLGLIATVAAAPLSFTLVVINACMLGLLSFKLYRATIKAHRLLREKHVPILAVIGKSKEVAEAMWQDVRHVMERWDFDAERYRRDFDVEREDIMLQSEDSLSLDTGPWLKLSRDFRYKIERIGGRLPGRRIFHVFVNGPISLALGLGAGIGTMHEIVVHQWFPGTAEAPYHPVVNFYALSSSNLRGMHFLEDATAGEFQYVTSQGEPQDVVDLYVSIWLARDDPRPYVNRMVEKARSEGASAAAFHIIQRQHRSLEINDDWITCSREVLTLVYQQISKSSPQRIHVFLSTPVALAFTLGMGIEHFMNVTVYNWWGHEQKYYPVLQLSQLARSATN